MISRFPVPSGWRLLAALLVTACNERSGLSLAAPSSIPEAPYRGSLLTHQPLKEALAQLSSVVGENAQVLEVRVYFDRILLQVRDIRNPDRLVEYVHRAGRVTGPVEVKLRGPGQLSDSLFALDDVKLAAVPELSGRALEQVDERAGRINYVLVKRNLPVSMDIQFRVYVSSPIKDGYIDADADGHVLDWDRPAPCVFQTGAHRGR